jgi:hypothetical protein
MCDREVFDANAGRDLVVDDSVCDGRKNAKQNDVSDAPDFSQA